MVAEQLFKKNSKGQIQLWMIETEGGKYRTMEGLQEGKKTITEWTEVQQKNVGRANVTSLEEQADKEALSRIQKQKDKGWRNTIEELELVTTKEVMLAHTYKGGELLTSVYSQPKLDGVRCKAYRNGLVTRNNKPIVTLPHIYDDVLMLFRHLPEEVEFIDGEIYNHDLKDDFNQIISIVKKQKPTPEDYIKAKHLAQYHIYDICMPGTFLERHLIIGGLVETLAPDSCRLVSTDHIFSKYDLDQLYEVYLIDGYEGQMIRTNTPYESRRTNALLKRKEFIDEEFEIVNIAEGVGNRSGMMGYVVLDLGDGNNTTFRSNARGTHDYFKELLMNKDKYIGKKATIRYQNRTPDNIPRFPVMVAIRDYE